MKKCSNCNEELENLNCDNCGTPFGDNCNCLDNGSYHTCSVTCANSIFENITKRAEIT